MCTNVRYCRQPSGSLCDLGPRLEIVLGVSESDLNHPLLLDTGQATFDPARNPSMMLWHGKSHRVLGPMNQASHEIAAFGDPWDVELLDFGIPIRDCRNHPEKLSTIDRTWL